MTLEELAAALDRLAVATEANTAAQNTSATSIAEMKTQFETWRETRCDDHQGRLADHDAELKSLRSELNRAIAKAAGAVGAVTFVATMLAGRLLPNLAKIASQ